MRQVRKYNKSFQPQFREPYVINSRKEINLKGKL